MSPARTRTPAAPPARGPEARTSRREFLKAGGVALAGTLLSGAGRSAAAAPSRPNFLILFTDDQNPACIGYASPGKILTPHLDRMARSGTVFEAAYAGAVPCTPSRGSLMTGLHGHRWNANLLHRLVPGEWTWAHALRRAGYHTALIGKLHAQPMRADHGFAHAEYGEHRFSRMPRTAEDDYERWLRENGAEPLRTTERLWLWPREVRYHPISWLRDRTVAYLDARKRDRAPFCLLASFQHPHEPCNPTREFAELYDPESIEVPHDGPPKAGELPERLLRSFAKAPRIGGGQGAEQLRHYLRYYYALVSQIDAAVGAIVARADLENTLVLFASDHGHYLGWRGLMAKEPYVGFEPVGRVPFFACGAGVPRGRSTPHPVSLLDVAPTLLRGAGLELPPDLDGRPLQEYFAGSDIGADRPVFCRGLPGAAGGFDALRRGAYKYFRSQEGGDELLFDLSSDPGERRNRARDPELKEIRRELAAEMDAVWARREHALPRVRETAGLR